MALRRRRPDAVIHHSDQGSQYTSIAFGKRCRKANVRPWDPSVTVTIMPCARASSPPWNASCWIVAASAPKKRLVGQCSSSHRPGVPAGSRVGTIRSVDTHPSAMHRLSDTRWPMLVEAESCKSLPVHQNGATPGPWQGGDLERGASVKPSGTLCCGGSSPRTEDWSKPSARLSAGACEECSSTPSGGGEVTEILFRTF